MVASPVRAPHYIGLEEGRLLAQVFLAGAGVALSPTAQILFVNSAHASAGTGKNGLDPHNPLSTIDEAVALCTASRGDVIVAGPGHVETVIAAAGLDLDVAGIIVLGIGQGDLRPTVNFTTAAGADMDVDAADIAMLNFLFTGGVDALTGPIDINSDDFALLGCEFRDVTGQCVDAIIATGDRLTIRDYRHAGAAAAGAQSAIQLTGVAQAVIERFHIDGNFGTAGIEGVTTQNTNVKIRDGYVRTRNAADVCITMAATDTGDIGPDVFCRVQDNAANITEAIVGADMQFFDPIMVSNADGERGLQWNGPASADA